MCMRGLICLDMHDHASAASCVGPRGHMRALMLPCFWGLWPICQEVRWAIRVERASLPVAALRC